MGEDLDDGWPGAVRAEIEADVRRVAERLRTLSEAQLAAEAPPYPSRAAGARTVAQTLADAAQALEERGSGAEPRWRDVPALSDFAVGDQVALTGQDLLTALGSTGRRRPSGRGAPVVRLARSSPTRPAAGRPAPPSVTDVRRSP